MRVDMSESEGDSGMEGTLTPEMITMQKRAETQPVIA